MPDKELTPEDLEMLKKRIELKYENFLRRRLRERRAQRHREEMRARLYLIQGGNKSEEPRR